MSDLIRQIAVACDEEGLKAPNYRTVKRRIGSAAEKHSLSTRTTKKSHSPLFGNAIRPLYWYNSRGAGPHLKRRDLRQFHLRPLFSYNATVPAASEQKFTVSAFDRV
jgi:hypothetical protein